MALTPLSPTQFQKQLITWQRTHGRYDLPWQVNPTPYRILVSEIMLQQTQVITVIPYFEKWMERFPTVELLAAASEDEVMSYWQGLGYYSRARNLRKAALHLMERHQGHFPTDIQALLEIPGVGRYTAGAIASFAFDSYGPIVDGNVKRLFCRYFGIEGVPGTTLVDKALWQRAETYTPNTENRAFAQGLLDMGATICKPQNPDCQNCPLIDSCFAFQHQQIEHLPTPKPKKTIPTKQGQFIWLMQGESLLLEKRAEDGIWGSLWCLPQIYVDPIQLEHATLAGHFKHTFTHYKLEASVWQIDNLSRLEVNQAWIDIHNLEQLGLPTPIRKFIEKHLTALL